MKAHELFGKAPWADLFDATIDLCYNGFEVGPALASAIRSYESDIRADENLGYVIIAR